MNRKLEEYIKLVREAQEQPPAAPDTSSPFQLSVVQIARQKLVATDYVEFRRDTAERVLSANWLAWREQLREVVRGNRADIPDEPAKY